MSLLQPPCIKHMCPRAGHTTTAYDVHSPQLAMQLFIAVTFSLWYLKKKESEASIVYCDAKA